MQAVGKGLGISLLPHMLVQPDIERGTVCTRDLCDEPLVRRSHIVHHRNKFLTRAAEDFLALCRRRAQEQEGDVSAAEIGNDLATIFAPARRIA